MAHGSSLFSGHFAGPVESAVNPAVPIPQEADTKSTMGIYNSTAPFECIVSLMLKSPTHRKWALGEVERLIMPPLSLDQYRLFDNGVTPIGFVSWAFLTKRAAIGYETRTRKLRPEDWNAGDRVWFIDFIAPGGRVREMVRLLDKERHKLFPGQTVAFSSRTRNQLRVGRYARAA